MTAVGALPADYVEAVRTTLAGLHLRERHQRDQPGSLLRTHAGYGDPIELRPGLTDAEIGSLDERFGLRFPPDLRSLLQYMLPIRGDEFPNWRDDPAGELETDREWLLRGNWGDIDPAEEPYFVLNDAGVSELVTPTFKPRLWQPDWGPAPQGTDTAYTVVSEQFARAPRLIRVFSHRFLPDRPLAAGNPVFSIVQTDIIPYGNDLADYFAHEFGVPRPAWAAKTTREIAFWSDLVRLNDG